MNFKTSDFVRFDSKVDTTAIDGCHPWIASTTAAGYGQFWLDGKPELAHRVSFEKTNFEIPPGMVIRHDNSCTKDCVNAAHLTIGTQADNMRDRELAGHTARGESSGTSKLKRKQVVKIRLRFAAGESVKDIAAAYPVTSITIRSVINRTSWKHV